MTFFNRTIVGCALLCLSLAISAAPTTTPATQPVAQSSDGTILLHARNVIIHGVRVRYEPSPHKNTVGFWTIKSDWVSWNFDVTQAGAFDVRPLQGCGKGSGGAEALFTFDNGQPLKMTVKDTGGFQNFIERNIGTVKLSAGPHTLSVKALTKPGVAVMDLRQVLLVPAKKP